MLLTPHPIRMRLTRPEYKGMEQFIDRYREDRHQLTVQNCEREAMRLMEAAFREEGLNPHQHMAAFSMEASALLLWGQWYLDGCQTVVLLPSLATDFLRSDIDELLLSDLLPDGARTFYLHLSQPGKPGLSLGAGLLEGAHVQFSPGYALRLEFIVRAPGHGLTRDWRYRYGLPVRAEWFELPAEMALAAALQNELRELDVIAEQIGATRADALPFFSALKKKQEQAASGLPQAARLLANTLAFMRHYPNEVNTGWSQKVPERFLRQLQSERPTERERARAKLWSLGIIPVQVLGAESGEERTPPAGTGTVRPHWRRGHWRAQPYGEGWRLRKLIYIRPVLVKAGSEKDNGPKA